MSNHCDGHDELVARVDRLDDHDRDTWAAVKELKAIAHQLAEYTQEQKNIVRDLSSEISRVSSTAEAANRGVVLLEKRMDRQHKSVLKWMKGIAALALALWGAKAKDLVTWFFGA